MKYRLTPRAEADVDAIYEYIAERNPNAALSLVQLFIHRWELLATQPHSGPARDDIAEGIRHLIIGEYLTFYRVSKGAVEIIRVLHGRRNISAEDISP